jgi:hypothetical protein
VKCFKCSKKLKAKKTKVDYFKSRIGPIYVDAKVFSCEPCKETYTDYGLDRDLKIEICDHLINPMLFKRCHIMWVIYEALCSNIFDFSKKINVHPQFLSDVVKGHYVFSDELKNKIIKEIISHFLTPVICLEN